MALLLTQDDLRPLVDDPAQIRLAIQSIEANVLEQARGDAGQATYLQFSLPGGPGLDVYSTSGPQGGTVRVFPQRAQAGAIDNQVMLLFDTVDGRLLAMLAGDDLNTLRTSLPAALGAKHLARPHATSLCILGSGQQAAGHLRGLSAAIETLADIRVYSPTAANRERFAHDWSALLKKDVQACATAEAAIRDADIVACTAHVHDSKDLPKAEWLKRGAVITTLVGAPPFVGLQAHLVVPSLKRPQTVFPRMMRPAEAPSQGAAPQTALAAILLNEARAREQDTDIVLFSIAAPYSWDAPVMRWAYDWAVMQGVGSPLRLTAGNV